MQRRATQTDRHAASLLDRLLDYAPDRPADPPVLEAETLAGLRESLRRDLSILLNTRCRPVSPPARLPHLDDSLVSLGVEDFFNASLVTDTQRQHFARRLQQRLARFEPRLEDLSVSLPGNDGDDRRSLRLRIQARYRAQPGLPPLVFDTRLDPVTHHFRIVSGAGRG
ncbi:type VI secretion system baseplate subunit TssE [Mesobaculum littorinae]|uniref:Type VI secretion system baseplate subunit TssE n=1 Tax=Mesobaculum littorinae TaxID=2486419 RepID=A0A438AI22_9RHOB|nr:type VI secretion system baseplate subunit TssE [Mesobaculum littorinae]RVV98304.1 type VI secretion system baseplate subunit TssE [Mesobaculum littorinae]